MPLVQAGRAGQYGENTVTIPREDRMECFDLKREEEYDPKHHVHKVLTRVEEGDATIACWEPGQTSPYHCHPHATEIYLCIEGGGMMRTAKQTVDVVPGAFTIHPPGEVHEFLNGDKRTILFRVRYGGDKVSRHKSWDENPDWTPKPDDVAYFESMAKG
jgi:quercetin dioxygenase-like cupin family protein